MTNMTYRYATDNDEDVLINTFTSEMFDILDSIDNKPTPVKMNLDGSKVTVRYGKKSNQQGTVYILTTEKKYIKSYKMFKESLNLTADSLDSIVKLKKDIENRYNEKTEELLHNLTSLNTYGIQDLFSLIPQKLLTDNINTQRGTIKEIINTKPIVTATTLLQLIKYNLAMKVEFAVFEKTMLKHPGIQPIEHPIRRLILSVIQIFITDFENNRIEISIGSSDRMVLVDEETLFVSFYYIFDNAVKYCKKNSKLKIHFNEEKDCFSVSIEMISIRIEENEVEKIIKKNYRSKNVQNLNQDGKGIGMYRIVKTLKMNNARLEIIPRVTLLSFQSKIGSYEHNKFKIKFIGQQDWFAS